MQARLAESAALSGGLHYVTLLRAPISRFLSEFYETYNGWEATHGTPPRLHANHTCAAHLSNLTLRARALATIDNTTKEAYDELFSHWIRCPTNMAASRQTRALAYAALATRSNVLLPKVPTIGRPGPR